SEVASSWLQSRDLQRSIIAIHDFHDAFTAFILIDAEEDGCKGIQRNDRCHSAAKGQANSCVRLIAPMDLRLTFDVTVEHRRVPRQREPELIIVVGCWS